MQPPGRDVVRSVLTDLIVGSISVEVASAWAGQWVYLDLPIISDLIVWKALKRITGADSKVGPAGYLYGTADFEHWLREFEAEIEESS